MILTRLIPSLGFFLFLLAHSLTLAADVDPKELTDGPVPLALDSIVPYLASSFREAAQDLSARGVIDGLLKISPRQRVCVDPGYGVCRTTGSCCPINGDCCSNGRCCDRGYWCYGGGCCRRDELGCANRGCCPSNSRCCSNGGCCDSGYYCVVGGCCRIGQVCGGSSGQCTRSGYSPCPGENFCCPTGVRCYRDASGPACGSSGGGGGGVTTRRTTSTPTSTRTYTYTSFSSSISSSSTSRPITIDTTDVTLDPLPTDVDTSSSIPALGPTTTFPSVNSTSASSTSQTTASSAGQGGLPGNTAAQSAVITHQGAYFIFAVLLPLFHFFA